MLKDKKGMGLVGGIIAGVASLVVTVIVGFVIVNTLIDADILTSGGAAANATNDMALNLSTGVINVSAKIPTILLIAAVVILFGAIALLVQRSRGMTGGGSL